MGIPPRHSKMAKRDLIRAKVAKYRGRKNVNSFRFEFKVMI